MGSSWLREAVFKSRFGGGAACYGQTPVGGIEGGDKQYNTEKRYSTPVFGPLRGPDVNFSRFAATRPDMEVIAELPQNPVFAQDIFGFLAVPRGRAGADNRGFVEAALR